MWQASRPSVQCVTYYSQTTTTSRSGEVHSHSAKERHASKKLTHGSTEAVEAEARTARSRFWMGCSNGRMSGGRLLPFESPPLGTLPTLCTYTGTHTHHTPVICFTLTLSCHERPQKQAEPNGNHHTNLFTTGEHGLLTTGGNTSGSHRGGAL